MSDSNTNGVSEVPDGIEGISRARLTLFVLLSLALSLAVQMLGEYYRPYGVDNSSVFDEVMALLFVCMLLAPGLYLIFFLKKAAYLKAVLVVAASCLILSRIIEITFDIRAMDNVVLFGANSMLLRYARALLLPLGLISMLAALYFALLETVIAHQRSLRESALLVGVMAQRERAEAALREQDDLYRRAIAQAGAIPYRIDWETPRYIFFDDSIYELTGYSKEELSFERMQSLPLETVLLGDLAGCSEEEAREKMAAGEVSCWQSEYKVITRLGEERWIADTSIDTITPGQPRQTIGLLTDITARKREEEVVRNNERHFRALIEHSSDVVTIISREGVIKYESPSVSRVLGYQPEELIGKNFSSVVHADDLTMVSRAFSEIIGKPGLTMGIEVRFRHSDGSWRVLEVVGRNMLDDPFIRGVITNSRDISDRRILQEQLLQSQKMEGIGRLAGGVAHDFNNMLTAIMGYAEITLTHLDEHDRIRRYIEPLLATSQRAAELTRQLLAFARKQIMEPKVVDLNLLCANMEKMLRRIIGEDIELLTLFQPGLYSVRIDPGQFEQVLVNLSVNARDAMPRGGRLTIETQNLTADDAYCAHHTEIEPGEYVIVTVSDTGCGMEPRILAHLFEPFFTTKAPGKGTGLGLAMCYGIIMQAGGRIEVVSAVGEGSEFKILLPRVEAPVGAEASALPGTTPQGGTETILFVEDEASVRSITREILENYGYTVLEAEDGQQALNLAASFDGHIDLLLTDVVMPHMSGKEVAERLRRVRPDIRALYISGYTEDSIVHQGILDKEIDFLAKPFMPVQLAKRIRLALDRKLDGARREKV